MKKKLIAGCLCAAMLATLLAAPAGATFPDVTDPQVQEAVEVLRQLEVIHGKPDGTFDPGGTFDRAAFCKMALTILGRQDEAQLHAGRVIFSDVTAKHWALGYINAAATVSEGATPLVRGKGDGSFAPDAPITCGEAVTILMRCLGYADADVGGDGGAWYAGHMSKAKSIELLQGLETLDGGETLTRAQAALLFENLLYTQPKDSQDIFLQSVLGGSVSESELVLEIKGKALSAGGWALKTDKGSYVTFRNDLSPDLQGQRCELVRDKEGNVLALRHDPDYTTRAVRIQSAEARYVLTEEGEQLLVGGDVPVWRSSQTQQSYADSYKEIVPGATALFCYDKTDALVSIYLTGDSANAVTAVAKEGSRPFDKAWEGTPTAVYKNGLKSSLSEVKPYDVGTFDPQTGVLELSDRKLTGVYENAIPSPVSPNTITVMGCDGIQVLDCALADLANFQLGDQVTLLLDRSNRVAGVVSPSLISTKTLGLATVTHEGRDSLGQIYTANVATTLGLTLKGRVRISEQAMEAAPGKLWEVASDKLGWLELRTPSSASVYGDWSVDAMTLGGTPVSPWVAVYDKAEGGALTQVGVEAVTLSTVPASKISFVHVDGSGAVDAIALRDVTGDAYTYGALSHINGYYSQTGGYSVNTTTTVTNAAGSLKLITNAAFEKYDGAFMGLAADLSTLSGDHRLAGSMPLTARKGVHRTAFGEKSVVIDAVVYPLAANIDACCYNAVSETWFGSLDEILAYSSQLTVYYDRLPDQGGKVRMVVAE